MFNNQDTAHFTSLGNCPFHVMDHRYSGFPRNVFVLSKFETPCLSKLHGQFWVLLGKNPGKQTTLYFTPGPRTKIFQLILNITLDLVLPRLKPSL